MTIAPILGFGMILWSSHKNACVNIKRIKMTLIRLPEFKGVIVQIVCAVEIQFESPLSIFYFRTQNPSPQSRFGPWSHHLNKPKLGRDLQRNTSLLHTKFHAPEPNGSGEEDFNMFLCISMGQTRDP